MDGVPVVRGWDWPWLDVGGGFLYLEGSSIKKVLVDLVVVIGVLCRGIRLVRKLGEVWCTALWVWSSIL